MLNIDRLIEAIRAESAAKFDMCTWHRTYEDCGTCACIGGTAELLMGNNPAGWNGYEEEAKVFDWIVAGTPGEEKFANVCPSEKTEALFYAESLEFSHNLHEIKADDAIKTLEHLRETGEVVWFID